MSAIAVENVSKHWTTPTARCAPSTPFRSSSRRARSTCCSGPSGCGKSTTLRLIAGLETADGGRVIIDGRDVTGLPPAQRNIAMVFQSYALFPHLTVAENILFGLRVRRVSAADCRTRLARVADLLGLSPLLARKPSQLSGGQQQRVALGRAIINEAPVCLMDEPLSNLDAQLRAEMRLEIRALQRKLGITMVYVTHDQVEAMSMADRVILLNGGRIEQNGTPVELYEQPANTFVARFIGTPPMNLLALEAGAGGAVIARRGRTGGAAGRIAPAACWACGRSTSASRSSAACARAWRASNTWAAIRWSRAGSARSRVAVRAQGSVGAGARRYRVAHLGARRAALFRGGRRRGAPSRAAANPQRRLPDNSGYNPLPWRREPCGIDASVTRSIALFAARVPASRPRWRRRKREVSFYYPVAVGGPITKIIDGLAADFEKENPGIKLKPIYSGSYQDSITKALTAVKSGEPPVTSILLSTDMYTLIDEDAIQPFDDLIKTPEDKAWLKSFYPAFMENSQTGGKTWGIPFQRSTIVLYYNKEMFKEAGLDPNRPPATWKEMTEYAQKLTKRDASGKVTQWGVQIPSSGFPVLAVPGARDRERRHPDERRRHADVLRQAGSDRRAAVLGRPREQVQGPSRKASSSGAPRRRISSRRRSR